jgi:hypothetical protein
LTTSATEAEKLSSVIAFTAKLADGVAAKVKQLDLAKVRFCSQIIIQLNSFSYLIYQPFLKKFGNLVK